MKAEFSEINVSEFNIDGFIKKSDNQVKLGGEQWVFQKNQVEFNAQWGIAIDLNLATLEIKSIYEPITKLDFSKLATYKATQKYNFTDLIDLSNEKEEVDKLITLISKALAKEYNDRLKGTKIKVSFPTIAAPQRDQFREYIISSLHKAIQTVKNFLSEK